jgi:C1A family cysteine protease
MPRVSRILCIFAACALWGAPSTGASRGLLRFERNDSLEALRFKIRHNGYSFTVGRTWVYDLSPEEREAMRGRRPSAGAASAADDIGPLTNRLGMELPKRFDWRDRDGRFYIGPVRNQGVCGSCYAFAAAAAAEGAYNLALGLFDGACADFSEAFIAWCLGSLSDYREHFNGCEGADYSYAELDALTREGIPFESVYPYAGEDSQACPDSASKAPRAVFESWHRVPSGDIEAIKTAIFTYGPVDAAVMTNKAFFGYTGGVYDDDNTGCVDGDQTETDHAVSLVGWDESPPEGGEGCWILRNSYGPEWGENGYMRIRYTAAAVSCAVSYLVYDESAAPVPTPVPPVLLSCAPDPPAAGSSFAVDVTVQPWSGRTVDAWAVVYDPRGAVCSFNPADPSSPLSFAAPLAVSVPGIADAHSQRLLSLTIPQDVSGIYRIVAGLVPAGMSPTGPESAVDGYLDQKEILVP